VGRQELPDHVAVGSHLEEPRATALTDQRVPAGEPLGAGDVRAVERLLRRPDVLPLDRLRQRVHLDHPRVAPFGAVIEDEDVPVVEHVWLVLAVEGSGPPRPDDLAARPVDHADRIETPVGEDDVPRREPLVAVPARVRLVGTDHLTGVVVRPVERVHLLDPVADVIPRLRRETGTEVVDVFLAAPLPDEFLLGGDLQQVRVAPEFGSQFRYHVVVDGVDEEVSPVEHLVVVVDPAVVMPLDLPVGGEFAQARRLDGRSVPRRVEQAPVRAQVEKRLDGGLHRPRVGRFALHVDETDLRGPVRRQRRVLVGLTVERVPLETPFRIVDRDARAGLSHSDPPLGALACGLRWLLGTPVGSVAIDMAPPASPVT